MSVSASDGAEKLAEELSGNDPELGAQMLLLAAAALAKSRATYLEAAREAFETARKRRLNSWWRLPVSISLGASVRGPIPRRGAAG